MQGRQKITIELFLIRHGMTIYNRDRRYLGRTDLPICEQGMEDLEVKLKTRLVLYSDIDQLFMSPMLRCRQTADILYPDLDGIIIDEWKEMDFGIFEGRTADEMEDDVRYRKWVDSGCEDPIPEGESRQDFDKRNLAGLKSCLAMICKGSLVVGNSGQPTLSGIYHTSDYSPCNSDRMNHIRAAAVVHAGTIMSIVSSYTDKGYYECYVKNGEGYCLCYTI